jgi:phosphoribosyl-AMP cyclohydrolase
MSETNPSVLAAPDLVERARFDDRGLIPVITQDSTSLAVLMVAWMDQEALRRTLSEGRVWYFSRSRQEYWRKGDQSGNTQHAVSLALDCDADVLLLQVIQNGPACHRGTSTCFDEDLGDG